MKLVRFRVRKFRNIIDSGSVEVEPDVTCLVGTNEAGKTAILAALNRLNPTDETDGNGFSIMDDYPRWLLTRDRRDGLIDETRPIEATFALDEEDVKLIASRFGEDVVSVGDEVSFYRSYDGRARATLEPDAQAAVANLIAWSDVSSELAASLGTTSDYAALSELVSSLQAGAPLPEASYRAPQHAEPDAPESADASSADGGSEDGGDNTPGLAEQQTGGDASREAELERVAAELRRVTSDGKRRTVRDAVWGSLRPRLPKFFYFSDYQFLPGRVDLSTLDIDESDRAASTPTQTVRSLLSLAGTTPDELAGEEYEDRRAELEAVSNELTDQVFRYWKQNPHLRVTFDVDRRPANNPTQGGPPIITPILHVRVEDSRYRFTNSFDQRSSGFRWFFSFLAAFTEFEHRERGANVVILLDEPGVTLHGRAQADFLHFINERLGAAAQVLYTTHSPFMVEPDKLDRVRVVEDGEPQTGSTVREDILSASDPASLFPLRAALGYAAARDLFAGGRNLLVERPEDFIFLDTMSRYLASKGMPHLDSDWRIMPAGGAGGIPSFVALIGSETTVSVLVDASSPDAQRLASAIDAGNLEHGRLVQLSRITGNIDSGVEDLFDPEDYLTIYNAAFARHAAVSSLGSGERIVRRLEDRLGTTYDHYQAATSLLRDQESLLPGFSPATLDRFAALFELVNRG